MHFYVGKIAMRTSAEATVAAATVVVAAPLCRGVGIARRQSAAATTSRDYRSQSS
jgi:hypothetical protein